MATLRVDVRGDDRIRANLARAAAHIDNPHEPLKQAADAVADRASELAPKDTGNLAGRNRGRVTKHTASVFNRVRYAGFQEHGTRVMHAHPFLRPALQTTDIAAFFEQFAHDVANDI
ncbi:hypothetical protein PBI_JEANIE_11 [Gordonia phage Jeanie]|uniref:Uncharacterized protein n=2 Tax=root TaxID=1 RepID=A0A160DHJ2_9CAUD|nr:HK97-gp10 family putative phage morphogenesis protein [Gordonia neofelifaecis]YP_009274023.1 tail completion or Neck1 protein [Gordonia phage McGonagall]ANA87589.1 hypothetical protein MCGONAGALL_11 [Gordonia phage McGonagall]ANA87616.1 hypothetical protein PBI_JEANIE_11 [Gordonia phage Jeanie]EGD53214.1 hypothetical protein SCNU_20042 [Gordonia neofelifaecis NRRL B-59395]